MQNETEFKDKLLLDTHKDVAIIMASIAEIKADLKEHIRRTGAAESKIEALETSTGNELKSLNRAVNMVHGALALISLIGIIAGIYKTLSN